MTQFYWFNIGSPRGIPHQEWWSLIRNEGIITVGHEDKTSEFGKNQILVPKVGDVLFVYASSKGCVGYGLMGDSATYKRVSIEGRDFLRHQRCVEWQAVVDDLSDAIPEKQFAPMFGLSHPVGTYSMIANEQGAILFRNYLDNANPRFSDHKDVKTQSVFELLRHRGISPNMPSTKWDVIDPKTDERFPPKAVLRAWKEISNDSTRSGGGGWPTNDPLIELGFQVVLKDHLEMSDESDDIDAIQQRKNLSETEKRRLVNARLGQGGFRNALEEIWNEKCALTSCSFKPLLRASHIKPWRESSDFERLDPNNGLLLSVSVDALFDRNYVSFNSEGTLVKSNLISNDLLVSLGIHERMKINIRFGNKKYLKFHYDNLKI